MKLNQRVTLHPDADDIGSGRIVGIDAARPETVLVEFNNKIFRDELDAFHYRQEGTRGYQLARGIDYQAVDEILTNCLIVEGSKMTDKTQDILELAKGIKSDMFASRPTIAEAAKYANNVIDSLCKNDRIYAMTAMMVVINTIANTIIDKLNEGEALNETKSK